MNIPPTHSFDLSPAEARELQIRLAGEVIEKPFNRKRYLAAGTDLSFDDGAGRAVAGVVVVRVPGLETVCESRAAARIDFPYIPGLLSFREIPALLEAFRGLDVVPDVIVCDGQGRAHPRRFGLACHLGLILGIPSIGCAKSLLVGTFEEPGARRGSRSPLIHRGETVGSALRTRDGVSPVYVSSGHLIDLPSARRVVLDCSITRIPEPTKRAHRLVTAAMEKRL
jgi:deoxyribonuclease V